MQTLEFLRRILPASGIYFLARLDRWTDEGGNSRATFKHFPQYSLEQMAAALPEFTAKQAEMYFACSAYVAEKVMIGEKERSRVQSNVRAIKAFWTELDVGPEKPFATQADALKALKAWLAETALPMPMVVSSGYGIHLYWPLTTEIHPNRWSSIATKLFALCQQAVPPLKIDPARSRDTASVLRPVGAYNLKNQMDPRPVKVLLDTPDIDVDDFEKRIDTTLRSLGIQPTEPRKAVQSVNSKFEIQQNDTRRYSGETVAQKCAQVAKLRDTKGNLPEPEWFHALQILNFCEDGEKLAHIWSSGYSGYTRAETDAKLAHLKEAKVGPTTCARYVEVNPDGCKGCPFLGKIVTPLSLGQLIEIAAKPLVAREDGEFEVPNPPWPYTRGAGKEAGIWIENLETGDKKRIYPYDLYPYDIIYDEAIGKELVIFRHEQPLVGQVDVRVKTEDIYSQTDLFKAFANEHVQIGIGKHQALMVKFVSDYIETLRQNTPIRQLYQSMGWKEDGFLLGETLYTAEGPIKVSVAEKVHKVAKALHSKGNREEWIKCTALLNQDGWEQYAWAFTAALGAPILKLAGYSGAVINLFSPNSGAGKTTAAIWGSSIYGAWDGLRSTQSSTFNAQLERLGQLNNLPFYLDEVTALEPRMIETLSYVVSDGRGRDRLNRDASLKNTAEWETFAICTSNTRMHQKLRDLKGDSEGNCARVFEAEFQVVPSFAAMAPQINRFLEDNYGLVGPEYIAELVRIGHHELRAKVQTMIDTLDRQWGVNGDGKQRFWITTIAAAAVGAIIGKKLGISLVDPARTLAWANSVRADMLGELDTERASVVELVAEFCTANHNSTLVVKTADSPHMRGGDSKFEVVSLPISDVRGMEVTVRVEPDKNTLYINRPAFVRWLTKRGLDPRSVMKKMEEQCLLMGGTDYKGKLKSIMAGIKGHTEKGSASQIRTLVLVLEKVGVTYGDDPPSSPV